MMPLVASTRLTAAMRARLREVLLGLNGDPAATPALHAMRIERFIVPAPGLYDKAIAVMEGLR
jgi:ABC-type phosphate/phosphonate transport system substrate-binding protein